MTLSLQGTWQCEFPDGRIMDVQVPGCFDSYVEEKDIGEAVIFRKKIEYCPDATARSVLHFQRVSYFCEIYINDVYVGSHEGMWDRFFVDVTDYLIDGDNLITVIVTKPGYYETDRFPLRQVLSGFLPDVLCTFGGIWGDVAIVTAPNFTVDYHYGNGQGDGEFSLVFGMSSLVQTGADFHLKASLKDSQDNLVWEAEDSFANVSECSLGGTLTEVKRWSPHEPNLYQYQCIISCGQQQEIVSGKLGFRTIRAEGSQMLLDDKPFYLRGVLHWGLYDQKIIPVPSQDEIKKEMDGFRSYGFNAVKHCLYIPTDEYLTACDEAGILQWIELPLWLLDRTELLEDRVRREYPRILNQINGHPSVILMSLGCELDTAVSAAILKEMYELVSSRTNTLVCDNSGSGECYEGEKVSYADFFDYHFYGDLHNMEPLMEAFTPAWRNKKPWLFGEFCDADSLINLADVRAQYGVPRLQWESGDPHINPLVTLKPDFLANFHDERIVSSGMLADFERLHKLSIDHCLTHRKTTLEMTRSFPEIGGYNITAIRDVPLSADGMFDAMGEPKYDTAAFRSANSDIVLCPAWDLTRVWLNADRVQPKERYSFFGGQSTGLHILLSNYSQQNLTDPKVDWELWADDKVLQQGMLSLTGTVFQGQVEEIGVIRCALPEVDKPETYIMKVRLEGQPAQNEWPVFVYPGAKTFSGKIGLFDPMGVFSGLEKLYDVTTLREDQSFDGLDVVVASFLTERLRSYAQAGGKVLLCQSGKDGALPAVPVCFWRESMIDRQGDTFLGNLEYKHYADDLRFWSVAAELAFDTTQFAAVGLPLPISWMKRYDARQWLKTEYVVELAMEKGRILATTLRLQGGLGKEPVGFDVNVFARWFVDQSLSCLLEDK